eukprot:TRINITY_DN102316_c0_g1_i1.p1 TRINITY_DN102316_c0_g1~~TRINITY_DN102316_c0_g1_i1.p1  ORF type:complete len:1104 (+),score=274.47 TRINITY_DN102316_c0_g1_i1:54-3365(+)
MAPSPQSADGRASGLQEQRAAPSALRRIAFLARQLWLPDAHTSGQRQKNEPPQNGAGGDKLEPPKAEGSKDVVDKKPEKKKKKKSAPKKAPKKSKPTKTVPQWFMDSEDDWVTHKSFHTLHLRKDFGKALLQVRVSDLATPFYNQLTFVGTEGRLPDMIDVTPEKATGFRFRMAPNGRDLLLTQMQQTLPTTDLASSLYQSESGGPLSGHVRHFKPLASDPVAAEEKAAADAAAAEAKKKAEEEKKAKEAEAEKKKQETDEKPPSEETPSVPDTASTSQAEAGQEGDAAKEKDNEESKGKDDEGKDEEEEDDGEDDDANKAPPVEAGQEAYLIDITEWLNSFAEELLKRMNVRPQGGQPTVHLMDIRAFPQNMCLRFMTQAALRGAVKSGADESTLYYTVGLCQLPETPMIPRAKDRRVGYFETRIQVGGELQVNQPQNVIARWNLERWSGRIDYHIDPDVPELFRPTIKKGVESWNGAFRQAGCGDRVVRCLAPGDEDFPADYARGDARYNAIYMTDSIFQVYGFGPSIKDFRSGEILVAHVLLGFGAFAFGASQHSKEVLSEQYVRPTGGCAPPLLNSDHPDVLKNILHTVVHEVGHTLGLRHNFIAQEDGNSSCMAYVEDLDTASDPSSPVYGANYLTEPGRYDVYAIKYGYTTLPGETRGLRHPKLDLLANGQDVNDASVSESPGNPLFATDEDIGGDDPRVNRWNSSVTRCGRDKIQHALRQRGELLSLVKKGTIFPETYSNRLNGSYFMAFKHILEGTNLIGGSLQDPRRIAFRSCSNEQVTTAVHAVAEFCVGQLARLSSEEGQHFMRAGYPRQQYQIDRAYLLWAHQDNVEHAIGSVLSPMRLERLEMQRAMWSEQQLSSTSSSSSSSSAVVSSSSSPGGALEEKPMNTLDLLRAFAFGPVMEAAAIGLLHPFHQPPSFEGPAAADFITPTGAQLNAAASDALRSEAAVAFAKCVNSLSHDEQVLAVVRIGARAFIDEAAGSLKAAEQTKGQDSISRAHWKTLIEVFTQEPDRSQAPGNSIFGFLFGSAIPDSDTDMPEAAAWRGMRCAQQALARRRRGRPSGRLWRRRDQRCFCTQPPMPTDLLEGVGALDARL